MSKIGQFSGGYRFLSNFYPCTVVLAGVEYPSVENAYQAAKRPAPETRKVFETCSPAEAKTFGSYGPARPNWDAVKIKAMQYLLAQKFAPGSHLAERLVATGNRVLEEGNTWGDTFWGVCNGRGENTLGRLLMAQRDRLTPASSPCQPPSGGSTASDT